MKEEFKKHRDDMIKQITKFVNLLNSDSFIRKVCDKVGEKYDSFVYQSMSGLTLGDWEHIIIKKDKFGIEGHDSFYAKEFFPYEVLFFTEEEMVEWVVKREIAERVDTKEWLLAAKKEKIKQLEEEVAELEKHMKGPSLDT